MASNIWANEQLSHNVALQNMQIAQKRDVIKKNLSSDLDSAPKVSLTPFSKSMQEKKNFFLLTRVIFKGFHTIFKTFETALTARFSHLNNNITQLIQIKQEKKNDKLIHKFFFEQKQLSILFYKLM